VLGEALGGGHSQNKGLSEAEPRLPLILRVASPKGFTVRKAQLLNILNLKSSSSQRRNFHGYNMPSEYTENDSTALQDMKGTRENGARCPNMPMTLKWDYSNLVNSSYKCFSGGHISTNR